MTDARSPEGVVEHRMAGATYAAIAMLHGITVPKARYICRRAMKAGRVTAEQIGHKPLVKRQAMTKEQYDKRFMERVRAGVVIDSNGCWIWQGERSHNGYGKTNYRKQNKILHRLVYQIVNSVTLPKKPQVSVCHTCDVRLCCNPEHLWAGSQKENLADSVRKGRHQEIKKTHCERGHEFTPENTYVSKGREGRGARNCKTCHRARLRIQRLGWTPERAYSVGKLR